MTGLLKNEKDMAKSDSELLLSEIAKKLRTLQCICENTANTGGAIVKDYQPLDCDGSPIGDPIDVMATIAVAKQDVSLCNYQQLADAINLGTVVPYLRAEIYAVPPSTTSAIVADLGVDITKLHSVSLSIIGSAGTATVNSTLGGASTSVAGLPVGFSTNWTATAEFETGDLEITTTADATVLLTLMLSA